MPNDNIRFLEGFCRSAHSSSLKLSQIHVLKSTLSIAIATRLMTSWINITDSDLSPGIGLELIPRHMYSY